MIKEIWRLVINDEDLKVGDMYYSSFSRKWFPLSKSDLEENPDIYGRSVTMVPVIRKVDLEDIISGLEKMCPNMNADCIDFCVDKLTA